MLNKLLNNQTLLRYYEVNSTYFYFMTLIQLLKGKSMLSIFLRAAYEIKKVLVNCFDGSLFT